MIQAITNFTTKISFKNIFGPIIKRILKIFFSDRRTANILRILGSFFGLFRFLNASLGFLIFLNVFDFKNFSFYSIPSSIISFLHLLKSNSCFFIYFLSSPNSLSLSFLKEGRKSLHFVSSFPFFFGDRKHHDFRKKREPVKYLYFF